MKTIIINFTKKVGSLLGTLDLAILLENGRYEKNLLVKCFTKTTYIFLHGVK